MPVGHNRLHDADSVQASFEGLQKMIVKVKRKKIGPLDQGRRMSLKAFEFAPTEEGFHYELSRGFITVSEVANFGHVYLVMFIRDAFTAYRFAHPELIKAVLTGMDCKLLIPEWDSERHPDVAVYFTLPKGPKNRTMWRKWIPDITIEVVSEGSADRDYVTKRQEYWTLGIKEYWIVDAKRKHVIVLRRGKSDWIENRLGPGEVCTTKLLPGFKLPCQAIFDAAGEIDE